MPAPLLGDVTMDTGIPGGHWKLLRDSEEYRTRKPEAGWARPWGRSSTRAGLGRAPGSLEDTEEC